MHVIFYSPGPGDMPQMPLGRVDLVDGKIIAVPPSFDAWLKKQTMRSRIRLDPSEGAGYLELLPKAFRSTYEYAVLYDDKGNVVDQKSRRGKPRRGGKDVVR